MGKELAKIAEHFFSRVPGATVEHAGGLLRCTATPAQIEEGMKNDPFWQAMKAVMESEQPCWECSKRGPWGRANDGGLIGGMHSFGVAKTLRDENGRCFNCETITSEHRLKLLQKRETKAIERARKALKQTPHSAGLER